VDWEPCLAKKVVLYLNPWYETGGYPIIRHIMKIYNHYGFKDFILCLGYKSKMIKDYYLNCEIANSVLL